jgi:hypothetical protein
MTDTTPEVKSEGTAKPLRRGMELVGERQVPEAPSLSTLIQGATTAQTQTVTTPPKAPPNLQTEFMTRSAWRSGVLGAINVLVAVVAVRFVLLLAVVGAFVLAKLSLDVAEPVKTPALIMLGVYCATVVLPMVWLASRR